MTWDNIGVAITEMDLVEAYPAQIRFSVLAAFAAYRWEKELPFEAIADPTKGVVHVDHPTAHLFGSGGASP
jgi:hypothetical protein